MIPAATLAHRLAERLHDGGQGERHPLAADYVLAEVRLGAALDGQTLAEAQIPRRFGITAVLLKRPLDHRIVVEEARAEIRLAAGAELLVVGKRDKIQRFDRECGEKS